MSEEKITLSGNPPDPEYDNSAPQPIDPNTGMHKDYWILSEEERAKGFVRPVRLSYRHIGVRPKHPIRELTQEEKEQHGKFGYVAVEIYPSPLIGLFWTDKQLHSGCGSITIMNRSIAETYARNPKFYGATFCANCGTHLRVGENG